MEHQLGMGPNKTAGQQVSVVGFILLTLGCALVLTHSQLLETQ